MALSRQCRPPDAILDRLHAETAAALAVPLVRERPAGIGSEPMPMSRTEMQAFFRKDVADTAALVKAANIPLQQ